METRNSQKRKECQDKQESQDFQPPAKRTRSQSRQTKAPAPPAPPRSARSQRIARPQSTRTKPTAVPGASTEQAASTPLAQDSPKPSSTPDATASAPDPLDRPAPSSMDAPGRRGSRGEAASSGGEDDRDAGDMFGRNLGAAGSALQGLLRKLGANFEDITGMSGMRVKNILNGMKQTDDESAQLSSLTELCELLSISTEESLTTFPVEQVVPLLVQLLGMEHNPDIMLLAARALTFMADVLPTSCSAIVRHGAVPAFCARLLTIEYIDLAEQSLQALEKLSHEHPHALLQNGGLMAVLSYLDFFPTGVQRTAVATAATMCTGLGPSHVSAVKDALPILCNLLQYQDAKVVDNACLALLHIAQAYSNDASLLVQLQTAGLINQALQLISVNGSSTTSSGPQTSVATYFGMIKLLSTCASGSAAIAQQLLKAGVVDTLRQLLANCAMLGSSGSASSGSAPVLRTPDQLYEVMTLVHELLPAVPDAADAIMRGVRTDSPAAPAAGSAAAQEQDDKPGDSLTEFLQSDPEMVMTICSSLLPLSLQVYSSTVIPNVRSRCLATIVKLLAVASPSQLQTVLAELPISSFIAGLLIGRDTKAQAVAIQMAEILMTKLPDVFTTYFVKEGVAHAFERLADAHAASRARASDSGTAAAPAGVAAVTGLSSAAGAAARRSSSGSGPSSRSELPPPSPPVTRLRSRRTSKTDTEQKEQPSAAAVTGAPAPPAAGRPASLDSMQTPSLTLRAEIARRAAAFKEQYFSGSGPGGAAAQMESEGLRSLKQLCEQLKQDGPCLAKLLEALTSNDVSVFEMITSGAVDCLTQYLQGNDLAADDQTDAQLLCRLRQFTAAALTAHVQVGATTQNAQAAACGAAASASVATTIVPLTSLVRKLQMALASSEAFPVLCSRLAPAAEIGGGSAARSLSRSAGMSGSFSGGSLTSGLAALTQPFKLRLVRHPEDTVLKEYPASIVLIEPLANMSAIEDFLWPRVNRGSTVNALRARAVEGSATRRDAPAGAAAATAAAVADNKGSAGGTDAGNAGTSTTRRRSSSGTGNSKDGSAARPPAASKAQPIPDADGGSGRLTRAQAARARAQAQARAEEAAQLRQARRGAAGGSSDPLSDEHDVMEDDDDGLMMRDHMSSDQDDEHMHDGDEDDDDHDMMDAGGEDIFNPDEDEDEDEEMDDADLGVGSMPVHDLHLTEGLSAAAMTAAAAAADTTAGSSRGAVDTTSNRSAPADAPMAAALDTRSSWRRSSQPLASAAAAAAASTGASAGGAARTAAAVAASALPRIVFYMNNHPLASTTTVFQAIQQGALNANGDADDDGADDEPAGLGGSGRRGRQLWDQIYTLYYKLGGTQQDDAVGVAAGSSSLQASSAGANSRQGSAALPEADAAATAYVADRGRPSHWRKSPLGELLAIKLPSNLAAPESCLDILKLVQLLEVINRLAPRLLASEELQLLQEGAADAAHQQQGAAAMAVDTAGCSQANGVAASEEVEAIALAVGEAAAGQMALAHVSRDEFISSKLSNKLAQQLKDVLAICGGGIPAWCHQLVVSCKFLFPFEIRRRYFYSTAFGLGRALHHMHQQQAAEGVGGALERDGRDLRIGRLQRQKVRVSRKRILESAVKVMELYAKHRAVLELEYFNEMGTGLGPTLEFYTMLSHELQKKALGMWRHEDPPEQQQQDSVDDVMQQDPLDEVTGGPSTAAAQQKQQEQQKEQAPRSNDAGGPDDKPSSAPASRPSSRGGTASEGVPPPSVQLHHEVMSHEQTTASAADYVYAPYGLFPAPLQQQQRAAGSSVVEYFRLLGRSVAKALQDNRLLDLPLNPVFFKAALGKPLDIYDLAQVDPVLGSSLERLAKAATAYAAAGSKGPLLVDGCPVNDLYLSFTLPGNASYELCPGGGDVLVDSSNLVQYIQGVVDATLGAGITAQMQAFREGFNEVFTLSALEVFYEDEMEVLLCGAGEHWSPQQLADSIKFDHGYTAQSTPVRHLLEILSELDPSDQRRFLRFVTGCPRLPPGGIAALQPRLTVVRKHPSLLPPSDGPTPGTTPGHSSMDWSNGTPLADGDLPSVMTCANYIKLPPYSCKDVMRERIMFAIREGQGSFDLS